MLVYYIYSMFIDELLLTTIYHFSNTNHGQFTHLGQGAKHRKKKQRVFTTASDGPGSVEKATGRSADTA